MIKLLPLISDMKIRGPKIPDIDMTPHHVEMWYNRSARSWVVQLMSKYDYQIGEATYVYTKAEAKQEKKRLEKEHKL